jgi:hypothetical protein
MSTAKKRPEVLSWAGTTQEVRSHLDQHPGHRLLVMSLDHVAPSDQAGLTEAIVSMGALMIASARHHNQELMENVAQLFVPRTPPSPILLREAEMQARARAGVFEDAAFMTAAEIAKVACLSTRNASAQPNKWKKARQIFAVHHNGVDYFPGYGLDAETGFRPFKDLATVIEVFEGRKDGWGLAYWFGSDNSFLGGKRPRDLLKIDPARVIAAARDEVEELVHG